MILYTNGTQDCVAIEKMMKEKGIVYTICDDVDTMREKGVLVCPTLETDDGKLWTWEAKKYVERL